MIKKISIFMVVSFLNVSLLQAEDLKNTVFHTCYDGDTCTFDILNTPKVFGEKIGVRMTGIDTPEIKGKCPKEKMLAQKAKKFLNNYLKKAKQIRLTQVSRDKYFRIDAIIIADEVNMNELMIKNNYAVPYHGGKKTHNWCST